MNYGIVCYVERGSSTVKIKQFFISLKKIEEPYKLAVVNNSLTDLAGELDKLGFEGYDIVNNREVISEAYSINQGLRMVSDCDFSLVVNAHYAIVSDSFSLPSLCKEDLTLGGTIHQTYINFKDPIIKSMVYKATIDDDLSWLFSHMYQDKKMKYIDKNIFIIKNSIIEKIGQFNSVDFDDKNYFLEFCMRVYSHGHEISSIKEIYSDWKKHLRFSLKKKEERGAKVVYPIIAKSVRQRLCEGEK